MIVVNNCGNAANEYRYIIYRIVDGQNWFWGATNYIERASQIQAELCAEGSNARIVESDNCDARYY